MNKITTKIYRIESAYYENTSTADFISDLMKQHNSSQTSVSYEKVDCSGNSGTFQLKLFVHNPKIGKPSWYSLLMDISSNDTKIRQIGSKYPSFILFFHNENVIFAITGGAGYKVIESVIDNQFGFKVVERLIDTAKDGIRGLSQRVFLGVELASSRFFKSDYVFVDEDPFGKYYKGLDVYIDNDKLKSIGVETSKKTLLVRGESGFKIDTKVSFEELLKRIQKLSDLLDEKPEIELNPFKKLSRSELKASIRKDKTFEELLNQLLIQDHFTEFQTSEPREIYHPNLTEYLKCSHIVARFGKGKEKIIPINQRITPKLILGYLDVLDGNKNITFPKFFKIVRETDVWIMSDEAGKKLYPTKLYQWFYGEVEHKGKNYLKFENEWFNYSVQFSNDLNKRLDNISERLTIHPMKVWPNDLTNEGDYNGSFSKEKNFLIGDGILHKGIEIADLISWTEEEIVFYHVKNGLDRNLRVLQHQVINSVKMILEFQSKIYSDDVTNYYEKLKIKSQKEHFALPELDEFRRILAKNKLHFVFAIATPSKNIEKESILDELKLSKSSVAKIAILHTYYSLRALDQKFSIAKIIREI